MIRFVYRKDSGELSNRRVIPVGFNFGERDKVLCIDLSSFIGDELARKKEAVEQLRKSFIHEIKELGLDDCYRQFFLDNIIEATNDN